MPFTVGGDHGRRRSPLRQGLRGLLPRVPGEGRLGDPAQEPPFLQRLRAHFGVDPAALPVVSETYPKAEHQNLHLAVEAYLKGAGRSADLVGIAAGSNWPWPTSSRTCGARRGQAGPSSARCSGRPRCSPRTTATRSWCERSSLDEAIRELVVQGGELTRSLLGAKGSTLGFGAGERE